MGPCSPHTVITTHSSFTLIFLFLSSGLFKCFGSRLVKFHVNLNGQCTRKDLLCLFCSPISIFFCLRVNSSGTLHLLSTPADREMVLPGKLKVWALECLSWLESGTKVITTHLLFLLLCATLVIELSVHGWSSCIGSISFIWRGVHGLLVGEDPCCECFCRQRTIVGNLRLCGWVCVREECLRHEREPAKLSQNLKLMKPSK